MRWFNKQCDTPDIVVQPTAKSRIEVEIAKNANKEAKRKADEVNSHVNDLLVENGFTFKIVLAAHSPRQKGGRA